MKRKYLSLLVASVMLYAPMVCSQSASTSPYSSVAYGLLSDNASGIQRSMGGVGYAMQGGGVINVMNPASYSQVDSLTFIWDMGVDLTNLWSKEGSKRGHNCGGGIDYLTAQFRIANHLGGSFGLLPYAGVGYSFGSDLSVGSSTHSGNGGLTQLYLGAGYEPVNGLSVGANFGYLFGTTEYTSTASSSSTTYFIRTLQVRDWLLSLGLQYALKFSPRNQLVVGVSYSPKKSFHGHTWGTYYDVNDVTIDTIGYTKLGGKFEQPHTLGVGLAFNHRNRLLVEFDGTYQPWSKAKYSPLEGFESPTMMFNNRWKVAGGLQYTAGRRGSYIGSMAFRVGAYYNHDYQNIDGNNLRDFGITCGVGLPVRGHKTTINIGFEWKHRYCNPEPLITENYFNITLGVNFNEVWFWKNKIR